MREMSIPVLAVLLAVLLGAFGGVAAGFAVGPSGGGASGTALFSRASERSPSYASSIGESLATNPIDASATARHSTASGGKLPRQRSTGTRLKAAQPAVGPLAPSSLSLGEEIRVGFQPSRRFLSSSATVSLGEEIRAGLQPSRLAVSSSATIVQWASEVAAELSVSVGLCGDPSADGAVNVFDAIATLQIIVGLIEPTRLQRIVADLNRDGTIDVFDAIMLLQHIVGMVPTLDGCGPLADT